MGDVPIILPERNNKLNTDNIYFKTLVALFLPYLALSLAQSGFLGLLPFVREEFALTRVQVGYYSTFFFISASLLSVFTGNIVDLLGPKRSMVLGIGSIGLLLILHGIAPFYNILLLFSFLSGLGFSILTPAATKAVMISTAQERRAFSMGITQTGFGLGGILGASILPFIGERVGWRPAVQVAATIVLLAGFLVCILYQDQSTGVKTNLYPCLANKNNEKNDSFWKHFSVVLEDKKLLKICILGILFGISEGALLSHFVVFLTEDLLINKVSAGLNFAILHFGGMVGLLGWGFFSDRFFNNDRRFSIFLIGLSSGIMYLVFGTLIYHPFSNKSVTFFFSFLFGLLVLGWSGVYLTTVGEVAGEKNAGIATGLSLLFARGAMIVAPPIFGFIADLNGFYKNSWLIFGLVITGLSFLFLTKEK